MTPTCGKVVLGIVPQSVHLFFANEVMLHLASCTPEEGNDLDLKQYVTVHFQIF